MGEIVIIDGNNYFRKEMNSDSYMGLFQLIEKTYYSVKPNIVVFDGFKCNELRRKFYPEYKRNRKPIIDSEASVLNLIKKIAHFLPWVTAVAENYEADDVIATLCSRCKENKFSIYSTDKDLMSIENADNPLTKPEFIEKCFGKKYVRLYKTLVGDPSDNIKGLIGFGDKSWESLSEHDREALNNSFKEGCPMYVEDLKLSKKIMENWDSLKTFWGITGFYDVPDDKIIWTSPKVEYNSEMIKSLLEQEGVLV